MSPSLFPPYRNRQRLRRDRRGGVLMEYALVTALVFAVVFGTAVTLGSTIRSHLCEATKRMSGSEVSCHDSSLVDTPQADAPAFTTAISLGTVPAGTRLMRRIEASDPMGHGITFALGPEAPAWLELDAVTGELTETDRPAGLRSANVEIIATDSLGSHAARTFALSYELPRNCQDVFAAGALLPADRVVEIDPSGTGRDRIRVLCHFIETGAAAGGWTVVAFQRADGPETDWNAGMSPRAPEAPLATSYALSTDQLPPHSHTGFGRMAITGDPTENPIDFLEAVALVYTTGAISRIKSGPAPHDPDYGNLPGLLDPSRRYDIHRSALRAFVENDPDYFHLGVVPTETSPNMRHSLTFDLRPDPIAHKIPEHTWSFSPNAPIPSDRGFAYAGTRPGPAAANFAWLVMVR